MTWSAPNGTIRFAHVCGAPSQLERIPQIGKLNFYRSLEHLTDYAQFERLCHDLMAASGCTAIEPLGGTKDKGRDALHVDHNDPGTVTIFAYSVREDWQKKLDEDCD